MVGDNLKPGHRVKIIDYRVDTAGTFGFPRNMNNTIGKEGTIRSKVGVNGYSVTVEGVPWTYAFSNLKDLEVKK